MQEAIILTKQEYNDLQDELNICKNHIRNYQKLIKEVTDHNYKSDVLVIELNIEKLKEILYHKNISKVIVIQK